MSLITYENLEDGEKVTANIFNERFAQIVAEINGKLAAANLLDGGITKEKLAAEVYESLYPVGSMYVNFTDNTNPGTLLGFGTWTAVAGRVVVGYDGTQTEFNAAEKTGGHKALQAHTHEIRTSDNNYLVSFNGAVSGAGNGVGRNATGSDTLVAASAGTGDSGNLQPYIVGYVWKRVS